MLYDVKKNKDGTNSIVSRRLTKTIRAADGTIRKMVSLDGESWRLASHEDDEALRLQRGANLQGYQWLQSKKQEFDRRQHVPSPDSMSDKPPVILPVAHHGEAITKKKGKAQKYRRNLRQRVPTRNVKVAKPAHYHNCPSYEHPHWRRAFLCSCERPQAVHVLCGQNLCLYE